jgi:hypothetical protein
VAAGPDNQLIFKQEQPLALAFGWNFARRNFKLKSGKSKKNN